MLNTKLYQYKTLSIQNYINTKLHQYKTTSIQNYINTKLYQYKTISIKNVKYKTLSIQNFKYSQALMWVNFNLTQVGFHNSYMSIQAHMLHFSPYIYTVVSHTCFLHMSTL